MIVLNSELIKWNTSLAQSAVKKTSIMGVACRSGIAAYASTSSRLAERHTMDVANWSKGRSAQADGASYSGANRVNIISEITDGYGDLVGHYRSEIAGKFGASVASPAHSSFSYYLVS